MLSRWEMQVTRLRVAISFMKDHRGEAEAILVTSVGWGKQHHPHGESGNIQQEQGRPPLCLT